MNCENHPEKKAVNVCHHCGAHFCGDCLNEGLEYYYCVKPQCQAALKQKVIPPDLNCPNCGAEISLNRDERAARQFHCPHCESLVDHNYDPPRVRQPDAYQYLFTTMNQGDLALIRTVFSAEKVDFYIFGQNFLSLDPLIQGARVYVLKSQIDQARLLLGEMDLNVFGASGRQENLE